MLVNYKKINSTNITGLTRLLCYKIVDFKLIQSGV